MEVQRKSIVALSTDSLSFLRNGLCPSALPRLHIPQSFMLWLVCPPLPTNILLLAAYLEGRNPLGRSLCYPCPLTSGWSCNVMLNKAFCWFERANENNCGLCTFPPKMSQEDDRSVRLLEFFSPPTVCFTNLWFTWTTLSNILSDEEHNKTASGKQLKHVAKKGIRSCGVRLLLKTWDWLWGEWFWSCRLRWVCKFGGFVSRILRLINFKQVTPTVITDSCFGYAMLCIITRFSQPCKWRCLNLCEFPVCFIQLRWCVGLVVCWFALQYLIRVSGRKFIG